MGAFDDLIPSQTGNAFADLIPRPDMPGQRAAPSYAAPASLSPPIDAAQEIPGATVSASPLDSLAALATGSPMPPEYTDDARAARGMGRSAYLDGLVGPLVDVPEAPGPVDNSSAAGDLEAGMLMAGQVIPGLKVAREALKFHRASDPDFIADLERQFGPLTPHLRQTMEAEPDRATQAIIEAMPEITSRQAQINQIPVNPEAQKIMEAEGWVDAATRAAAGLGEDPYGVLRNFVLRSLPASAPSIVAGTTGFTVAGPAGAAVGGGLGEFATELGLSTAQGMQEALTAAGVDPTDTAAVEGWLAENPAAARQIVTDALQRAGIIGTAGAATGGLSGALVKALTRPGKTASRRAAEGAAAVTVEPVGEAAGEAAAGGSPADVVAEALGGFGQGVAQTGGQTAVELARQALSAPQRPAAPPQAPTPPPATPAPPEAPSMAPAPAPEPPRPPEAPAVDASPPVDPTATAEPAQAVVEGEPAPQPVAPAEAAQPQQPRPMAQPRIPKAPVASFVGSLPSDRRGGSSAAAPARGIDPEGPAGQELKANGVTPRRFPRLFRKGGRQDVDNIPADELPAEIREVVQVDPNTGYVDRNDPINAIIEEANEQPRRTAAQAEVLAAAREQAEEFAAPLIGPTDADVSDRVIPDPEMDIREPGERRQSIIDSVRDVAQAAYGGMVLQPDEEARIADMLDERGGSVDSALNWFLIQEAQYVETDSPDTFEPIPFPEPGEDQGADRAGDGEAGTDGAADGARAPGAGRAGSPAGPVSGDGDGDTGAGAGTARTGTTEGGRVDLTPEGEQTVIPGAEQITDKQRGERQMARPMQGGDAPPPEGGLFSPPGPDLFDDRDDFFDGPDVVSVSSSSPEEVTLRPIEDRRGIDAKDVSPEPRLPAAPASFSDDFDYVAYTPEHYAAVGFSDDEVRRLAGAQRQYLQESGEFDKIQADLEARAEKLVPEIMRQLGYVGPVADLSAARRRKVLEEVHGSLQKAAESLAQIEKINAILSANAMSFSAFEENIAGVLESNELARRTWFSSLDEGAEKAIKNGDVDDYFFGGLAEWALVENALRKTVASYTPSVAAKQSKPVTLKETLKPGTAPPSDPPKPKKTGPQPKGSLGPTFVNFSFTDKNSVFRAAFRAAGLNPDQAQLLSVDQQIAALRKVLLRDYGVTVELPQKLVKSKTITGKTKLKAREQINARDAIDQMLDAYRQMEMLAHVFGVPRGAIGLREHGKNGRGITLSLVGRLRGALGSYSYTPDGVGRTITLPGRSNSFAHEWGHALDHYVGMLYADGDWSEMLSRRMRDEGVQNDKRQNELAQAFVGVLQALFGDRAGIAAMQISLQTQAAEVNRQGKPTKKAKEAKQFLADIEVGKSLPNRITSKFFRTSKDFDDAFGGGGYFTDPAEMFARAMETFAGVKARQVSPDLPTSFLAKPDWAYTSSEETRASMTFPRGVDAEVAFAAIERLGDALRQMGVFGEGRAAKPEDVDIADPRHWDKWRPKDGLIAQEKQAWASAKRADAAIERTHPPARRVGDAISYYSDTFGGHLHRIIDRQPKEAQKALRNLVDMFVTDPGSGRKVNQVWEEAVEARTGRILNRFENIVKAHKLTKMTDEQADHLRQLLTDGDYKGGDANLRSAAAALRNLMDAEWRYLTEAGVKVGYVRNGWLPRIPDIDAVVSAPKKFAEQAQKVYRIVFNDDIRTGDINEEIDDVRRLIRQIEADTIPTDEGDRTSLIRFTPDDETLIESWKAELKKLQRIQNQAKNEAKGEADGDKLARLQEQEAAQIEVFQDIHGEVLDMLEDRWSEKAAEHWRAKILTGGPTDFDSKGPSETFSKKRKLPAEADKLMAEFYHGDPLTLIEQYIHQAARRAEWVRRAGRTGEKIENMLGSATRQGADSRDVREIRRLVDLLAGRSPSHGQSSAAHVAGWAYVGATVALLNKATLSSLAEPFVIGLRTGRMRDQFRAMARTVRQLVRTGTARDRAELARIIGLTRSAMNETVMLNRYGGDVDPNQTQTRIMSEFFRRIGLTGLTNIQREAMMTIGADHLRRMLEIDGGKRKPLFGVAKKRANQELNDMGVDAKHREALLEWLEGLGGDLPTPDDLMGVDGDFYNDAAAIWATAVNRFANTVIQNPRRYTRPAAAQENGTRLIYGITGFIYSFHREVLNRIFKHGVDARREGESRAYAALRQTGGVAQNMAVAAAPVAVLYSGHLLSTILREAIFNSDRLEEMDDDEIEEYLLKRAFSQTGLMGAYDIPYNLLTGLRYERDLASLYAGPHHGYWLSKLEATAKVAFGRNSGNTTTTERRAAKEVADAFISSGGDMVLSALPGGPLTRPVYGGMMYGLEALSPAEILAGEMFPE